jgi:hypothetical protein
MAKATRIQRENHPVTRKLLDLKLGYLLLGDRRVPVRCKVAAFAIGLVGLALLGVVEFPVEEIMAMAIPFLGIAGDLAFDGVEAFVVPVLFACLLLPYLAPSSVVDRVRRERDPVVKASEGPIIDV